MELRHLAAFEAVARERSVSRAADELGYTQSAVSQQLAALERLVGVALVERRAGARTVALTAAGTQLLAHTREIRERLAVAQADMAAFALGASGLLRIGSVPSVAAVILPPLLAELRRRAPAVDAHVVDAVLPEALLGPLVEGGLDLVFAVQVDELDGIAATPLMRDPYGLLVPADDPLVGLDRPLDLADLAGRELIGKDCRTPSQRALDSALAELELTTTPRIRAHDAKTVHALVGAGLGAAVLPRLLVDANDPATRFLPLDHLLPDRTIAMCSRRAGYRSPCIALAEEIALAAVPAWARLAGGQSAKR